MPDPLEGELVPAHRFERHQVDQGLGPDLDAIAGAGQALEQDAFRRGRGRQQRLVLDECGERVVEEGRHRISVKLPPDPALGKPALHGPGLREQDDGTSPVGRYRAA